MLHSCLIICKQNVTCQLPVFVCLGAVWVYSTHYPNYNPTSGEQYCQKTVYLFAYWFTNLSWVAVGLMLLCGGYLLLYACVRLAFRGHHLFPSNQKTYDTEGQA